eukprot:5827134-Pyramimonas_sp.AAC.1
MCWPCAASNHIGPLLWTNSLSDAGWRDTMFTRETFVEFRWRLGVMLPVLFLIVGLRLENIMIDALRAIDLGVCAHVVGNIMWLYGVRRNVFKGGAQADRICKME